MVIHNNPLGKIKISKLYILSGRRFAGEAAHSAAAAMPFQAQFGADKLASGPTKEHEQRRQIMCAAQMPGISNAFAMSNNYV